MRIHPPSTGGESVPVKHMKDQKKPHDTKTMYYSNNNNNINNDSKWEEHRM